MPLKLNSSGGGSITLQEPTTASNLTLNLPSSSGTTQLVGESLTRATAVSASGTSIDFTGIPSWVKRITVMFNGVSTNGTSPVRIRVGSGSIVSSGYLGSSQSVGPTNIVAGGLITDGVGEFDGGASVVRNAVITFVNLTGNTWIASGLTTRSENAFSFIVGGSIALSGTLDRLRLTTVNGTDTFDAGTINIMYEG